MYFIPDYSSLSGFLAANPGWVAVATTVCAPIAGLFNGGSVTIPNIAPGANAYYIVIGWSGSAASLDGAIASGNAKVGESALFTTGTGNPTTTPPETAVPLSATFTGLTLANIPEPSTFALTGLGLASSAGLPPAQVIGAANNGARSSPAAPFYFVPAASRPLPSLA